MSHSGYKRELRSCEKSQRNVSGNSIRPHRQQKPMHMKTPLDKKVPDEWVRLALRRNEIFVTLTRTMDNPRYEVMFLGHDMKCNQHDLPAIFSSCTRHATFEREIKAKLRESEKNTISEAFRQFAVENTNRNTVSYFSSSRGS